MRFEFTEDQRLLQEAVRGFLEGECGTERLRALWDTDTGRSRDLWRALAEVGLVGALVPEAYGGLGLDEVDFVLLAEEVGRAGLAEPVTGTCAVAAPLLAELGSAEVAERWLAPLARGEAIVAVAHPVCPFVDDAHVADLLLCFRDGVLLALAPKDAELEPQPANDPARRIQRISFAAARAERLAEGGRAPALADTALDRGALCSAAQQVGAADRLIGLAVAYASQREQFGAPVGSFQAVKHMLANAKLALEYARPLVYRAAWSVARGDARRDVHVSMAKTASGEAAALASRVSLQVHGAIGYTWEQDVHLFMRRARSLDHAWGLPRLHRRRMAEFALAPDAPLGAGATFL